MGDAPKPKPKFEGPDRRERYRLSRETKILVRTQSGSAIGTIENMTRNGIFLLAFGDYQPGMSVEVTFPYDPSKPTGQHPLRAEVVRVQDIDGSLKKGVAVKLLNIFLKA